MLEKARKQTDSLQSHVSSFKKSIIKWNSIGNYFINKYYKYNLLFLKMKGGVGTKNYFL